LAIQHFEEGKVSLYKATEVAGLGDLSGRL